MKVKYSTNEAFEKPSDENVKIWRYLDFSKFVSLLDRKALFFARADTLGDPFEGSYSKANLKYRPTVYQGKIPEQVLKSASLVFREIRRYTVLSCWNICEYDSAALWKLYLNGDGVAIQSTFRRLTQCFGSEAAEPVFIGKIKYIDYEKDWMPEGNMFYPFVHKRKSFESEQELRAVVMKFPPPDWNKDTQQLNLTKEVFNRGEYIDIDLDTLVEKVYVSPTSQEWFLDLVKSVSAKYSLEKEIIPSGLADKNPVY